MSEKILLEDEDPMYASQYISRVIMYVLLIIACVICVITEFLVWTPIIGGVVMLIATIIDFYKYLSAVKNKVKVTSKGIEIDKIFNKHIEVEFSEIEKYKYRNYSNKYYIFDVYLVDKKLSFNIQSKYYKDLSGILSDQIVKNNK